MTQMYPPIEFKNNKFKKKKKWFYAFILNKPHSQFPQELSIMMINVQSITQLPCVVD